MPTHILVRCRTLLQVGMRALQPDQPNPLTFELIGIGRIGYIDLRSKVKRPQAFKNLRVSILRSKNEDIMCGVHILKMQIRVA